MHSVDVSLVIFVIVFGGAVVGILLGRRLPTAHFTVDAVVVIRLAAGFVVTMTGIVLGMLVSSAKASYDAQKLLVTQMSSEVILLDRALREYGPEADPMRSQLRELVQDMIKRVWPAEAFKEVHIQPGGGIDMLEQEVKALVPTNQSQATAQSQAVLVIDEVRQASWLIYIQSDSNSLSTPLLFVLVCWLVAIFMSFGLLAPPNGTVIATLIIGALAVSAAFLIILEMYSPFSGILRIPSTPMLDALSQLRR